MHLIHAGLLCVLFGLPLAVPALRAWPLFWLTPLGCYAVIVAAVPALRRGVTWLRFGRFDGAVIAWTVAIITASSAALVLWFRWARPDVADLARQLPRAGPAQFVLLGLGFALLNAGLEEAVFRGVFQEALTAEWGPWWGAALQGVLFGVVHARGFPRGAVGMAMASAYGVALGLLRLRSGGLGASYVAHVCADATIFARRAS